MPIHDWTRVNAGLFHAFHHRWISAICDSLNTGGLPPDYFALPEQQSHGPGPDVVTLRLPGIAVADVPPRTRVVQQTEADLYARRAHRLTVRHRHGDIVAVVEIVSPGNKASQAELRALVEKSVELLRQGVHLLIVDLFPPSRRDPQGIHKAIWDEFNEEEFALPPDKPLTLAAYAAGPLKTAYVEPVAVGGELPAMPLFLEPDRYVPAPLAATYELTWSLFPAPLKQLLEGGT